MMTKLRFLAYSARIACLLHGQTEEDFRKSWELEKESKWAMNLPHRLYIEMYSDEMLERIIEINRKNLLTNC
jgi:hypothetical protein